MNALRKVDIDVAFAAFKDLGYNNAKVVALYSDQTRFADLSREKQILYQGRWILLSEHQQISGVNSQKIYQETGNLSLAKVAQLTGAIVNSESKVEQYLQSKIQTTDDVTKANLVLNLALQQDTNQDINLGRTIFNAKGLLADWGLYNMGASAFPLLNRSNGE